MSHLQRVLYVDDDPDIRTIACLALKHAKYEVDSCDSGVQALKFAPGFRPDLILMDVMMPELDGPTTLAEMRKDPALQAVPVIFISAKVQKGEVAQYLRLGAIGVISKPFDPVTLGKDVNAIWTSWRSERNS